MHPFGNGPQIPRSGVLDMVSTQSIDAAAAALTQLTRLADDDSRRGGSSEARRRSLATGLDACAPFLLSTGGSPSPRASIFHARRACGVAIPARARAINEYAIRSDQIVGLSPTWSRAHPITRREGNNRYQGLLMRYRYHPSIHSARGRGNRSDTRGRCGARNLPVERGAGINYEFRGKLTKCPRETGRGVGVGGVSARI